MQVVTSSKKIYVFFLFSLDFGQRRNSWALVSMLVVVKVQALAWVHVK